MFVAIVSVALLACRSLVFATNASARSGDQEDYLPSFVGEVTAIDGLTLTVDATDKNTYTVDASDAKVVKGFLGYWAQPSAFSNIEITDTVTIIGALEGTLISATDIAANKTPKKEEATTTDEVVKKTIEESATTTGDTTLLIDDTASSTATSSSSFVDNVYDSVVGIVQSITDTIFGTTTPEATTTDEVATTTEVTIVEEVATSTAL